MEELFLERVVEVGSHLWTAVAQQHFDKIAIHVLPYG